MTNRKLINPELSREIDLKLSKIRNDLNAYEARSRLVRDSLINIGDVYSFWIENPDLREKLLLDKSIEETVKRKARKGIRNVHNAWYFATQFGMHNDFVNFLDVEILKGINSLVNGRRAVQGQFRTDEKSLDWLGYRPPKPKDVPSVVKKILYETQRYYYGGPLETSIRTHLDLALAQPFDEGNKRTARIVQNRMLIDYGYPPAVIPAGEAKFYFDVLRKAAPVPIGGSIVCDEVPFFNYTASKVNNALDEILGDLNSAEIVPFKTNPSEK